MKYSLLDMTQVILSSLDGDEVNSISDTSESMQVARIIRTVYFNIINRAELPEHFDMFQLEASGDDALPIIMYRPENVAKLDWVKYDTNEDPLLPVSYNYVTIIPFNQYADMVANWDFSSGNTSEVVLSGFTIRYQNDRVPTYCTILKDRIIIFDAYNSTVEDTLQSSKTLCYGQLIPSFLMEDGFIPELDDSQFPLLLNEAKALAFLEMKQMAHEISVRDSNRQWTSLQRTKNLKGISPLDNFPNFARRV